jgi:hypothetical protein
VKQRQRLRRTAAGTEKLATDEIALVAEGELAVGDGGAVDDLVRTIAVKNEKLHLWRTGGTPMSEDDAFDNTTALNDALALAAAAAGGGGGSVDFGPHIWGFEGEVEVPNKVNLVGPGGSTVSAAEQHLGGLEALHADAQLAFGNLASGSNRGGYSGGFSVNGGGISNRADGLLAVLRRSSFTLANIAVTDTLGTGAYLAGTQNSIFPGWNVARCATNALVLDTYVSANIWIRPSIRAAGGYLLTMEDTMDDIGGDGGPNDNVFLKAIFEDDFDETGIDGVMNIESSDANDFYSCQFVTPVLNDTALSANIIGAGTNVAFHSCTFNGKDRTMEAIMRVEGNVLFSGRCGLLNATNGIRWQSGGTVRHTGYIATGGLTNMYHASSTSSLDDNPMLMYNGARPTFVDFEERSTAPSSVANHGIVYTRDNGGGKTELVVRFGTGAIQVIATEP